VRFGDSNGVEKLWGSTNRTGNVGAIINICKSEHGVNCFQL